MNRFLSALPRVALALSLPACVATLHANPIDDELRASFADALETPDDRAGEPQPFSLAISGGSSLGAYESGVSWALLRMMKDLHDGAGSGRAPKPALQAAAGASAGAINGFLAGLLWCSKSYVDDTRVDTLTDNVLRNAWRDLDINRLIDHSADEYAEDNAAFSRDLVRDIQGRLEEDLGKRRFREGCDVAFGLSLTRSRPVLLTNAGVDIRQQRLVLPMVLQGTAGGLEIRNLKMPAPAFDSSKPDDLANRAFRSSVIYLDSGESPKVLETTLGRELLFDAIKASSSFPVAFAPKKLSYCLYQSDAYRVTQAARGFEPTEQRCPKDYRRLTSLFVDGGVFDNDPLELVRQLTSRQLKEAGNAKATTRYIKIDPEKRRPPVNSFQFEVPEYAEPGDSLDLALWLGDQPETGALPTANSVNVRHCRFNKDAGRWEKIGDHPIPVAETAKNSRLYVGTIHTSPPKDKQPLYVYEDADLSVRNEDRLMLFHPREAVQPGCDPASHGDDTDKFRNRTIGILEDTPQGLSTQLGFVGGAVTSARGYRLYDELLRNNWRDGNYRSKEVDSLPLLQPARLTPLVGELLGAFAAFLDVRFRDFDYYAGIYDGVYGMAEFVCLSHPESTRDQCRARQAEKIYLQLCAPGAGDPYTACRRDAADANAVMYQLIVLERCGVDGAMNILGRTCELGEHWGWIERLIPQDGQWAQSSYDLLRIGATLQDSSDAVKDSGRSAFVRFVKELSTDQNALGTNESGPKWTRLRDGDSALFNRMLARADRPVATWYYPLSNSVIPQLIELEDADRRARDSIDIEPAGFSAPIKAGLALSGLASESVMEDPDGWQWDQTSVPSEAANRWVGALAPSELAIDSRNGGISAYWNPGLRFKNDWAIDFRLAPYLRQRIADETIEFSEGTAFVTRRFANPLLSSVGLGPTYTYTWGDTGAAKDDALGVSASVGLLADKLRITYGVRSFSRDEFLGDDIYFHIGVNDLPGIFYWACRGAADPPGIISWVCR